MPRLQAYGRKFSIGSDDLFLPAMLGVVTRLGMIAFHVVALLISLGLVFDDCDDGQASVDTDPERFLLITFAVLVPYFTFMLMLFALLWHGATRGTPCETERRKNVVTLLPVLLLFYAGELLVLGWLIALAVMWPSVEEAETCSLVLLPKTIMLGLSIAAIVFDLLACFLAQKLLLNRFDPKKIEALKLNDFDISTMAWTNCLKSWCGPFQLLFCNLLGFVSRGHESEHIFISVAEVFSLWFYNTDLTLTDLATGFILLRVDDKERRERLAKHAQNSRRSSYEPGRKARKKFARTLTSSIPAISKSGIDRPAELSSDTILQSYPSEKDTYEEFKEMYTYLPYVMGIYGWKLLLLTNALAARPLVGVHNMLPRPQKAVPDIGNGDGCCRFSQRVLVNEFGINPDDVVYAHFSSIAKDSKKSVQIPHAVIVNHKQKSIVITIRGTLSLQDMMTDVMLEPVNMSGAGRIWGFDGSKYYAHAGFLGVAMRIRGMLEKNTVLHSLLGVGKLETEDPYSGDTEGFEAINVDFNALPDCKGYKVVVAGHSAGAGVGVLLALLLRPSFPGTKCLAYSCPGFVVNQELAEETQHWCTNIWLADDFVPRVNWQALRGLRLRLLDVLRRCKVSKARVFWSALRGQTLPDILYASFEVPKTPGREKAAAKIEELESDTSQRLKFEEVEMHSAGRLLHMVKTETLVSSKCCRRTKYKRIFEPFWVTNRRATENIVINSRSFFDHIPQNLSNAMKDCIERHEAHDSNRVDTLAP